MENKLTCVTGYWKVKNKHDNNYIKWFKNTLKVNCPYIVYGNKESIEEIKKHRINLPTYYIEYNIDDFYSNKYKESMIINNIHCPSTELNMIWNEKIIMIDKAANINPFNSEFFCWVDAGICCLRDKSPIMTPFPNIYKLDKLPKNKFIYSSSLEYDEKKILNQTNYHHISGTAYILHTSLIRSFCDLYKKYMEKLINKNNIWTDQVILSHIYIDNKNLFYKLCDGYGEVINNLY